MQNNNNQTGIYFFISSYKANLPNWTETQIDQHNTDINNKNTHRKTNKQKLHKQKNKQKGLGWDIKKAYPTEQIDTIRQTYTGINSEDIYM
jgi:hypothetical protein